MAIEQPDFSKIFADGATIGELLNMPDEEYLRGWGYLGQNEPPPMEYFNYIYNLQDNKLKYLFISANIRKSNTQYHVDDIVTSPNLQSKFMLVCIQEGTTDSNEPVLDAAEEGQEITDGTAKFKVHYFKEIISSVNIMSGATSSKGGTAGLVPAPSAGAQNKALFGDGTYKQVVETINGIKPNEDNNITLITGINMRNRKKHIK